MADDQDSPAERWVVIPGFPDYDVSDMGRVRSRRARSVSPRAFSPADVAEVKRRVASGERPASVAKRYGVNPATVYRVLRDTYLNGARPLMPLYIPTGRGYYWVGLYNGTECARSLIHRVVAKVFIPNPHGKPHVNHLDGNPANNAVANLEWCTQSENVQHAIRTGLFDVHAASRKGVEALRRKRAERVSDI
jgi:hypothetical protein